MFYFQLYALLAVLLITLLAMNVSRVRMREKIANGDDHKDLKKATRAHMNAVEHCLPYGLLILALAQLSPYARWLPVLVIGFIAAKLVHSYSMLGSGKLRVRQISAGVMYLFELAGCALLIVALLATP